MKPVALSAVYDVTADGTLNFHALVTVEEQYDGRWLLLLRDHTEVAYWDYPAKRHALKDYAWLIRHAETVARGFLRGSRRYVWDSTDVPDVPVNKPEVSSALLIELTAREDYACAS